MATINQPAYDLIAAINESMFSEQHPELPRDLDKPETKPITADKLAGMFYITPTMSETLSNIDKVKPEEHPIINRPDKKDSKELKEEIYKLFLTDKLKDFKPRRANYPICEMEWLGEESVKQDLFELFRSKPFYEFNVNVDKLLEQSVDYFISLVEKTNGFNEFYNRLIDKNIKSCALENQLLELKGSDLEKFIFLYKNLVDNSGLKSSDLKLIKDVLSTYLLMSNGDEIDKEAARDYIINNCWMDDLKKSLKDNLSLLDINTYSANKRIREIPALHLFKDVSQKILHVGENNITLKKYFNENKAGIFKKFIDNYYCLGKKAAAEYLMGELLPIQNEKGECILNTIQEGLIGRIEEREKAGEIFDLPEVNGEEDVIDLFPLINNLIVNVAPISGSLPEGINKILDKFKLSPADVLISRIRKTKS